MSGGWQRVIDEIRPPLFLKDRQHEFLIRCRHAIPLDETLLE